MRQMGKKFSKIKEDINLEIALNINAKIIQLR